MNKWLITKYIYLPVFSIAFIFWGLSCAKEAPPAPKVEPELQSDVKIVIDPNLHINFAGKNIDINWVSAARSGIFAVLSKVPEVGGLLTGIVGLIWPAPKQSVWPEIRDQVATLVGDAIAAEVCDTVSAKLGNISTSVVNGVNVTTGTGLIGVVQTYLNSAINNQDPKTNFQAAHNVFVKAGSDFMLKNYGVALLPFFVQFANLHLALLRDGILKGWYSPSQFAGRMESYKSYIKQWFLQGYADRLKISNDFNYMNDYVRQMQLTVLDFSNAWKFFDPTVTLSPVNDIFNNEIYETLSERLSAKGVQGQSPLTYNLRPQIGGYISQIYGVNLFDYYDNYNLMQGMKVDYSCGGLSNCLAASPAYPVHCECSDQDTGAGPCFIQVGGLDPNAVDNNGNYLNNINQSSCCSLANIPATLGPPNQSLPADYSCRYFDSMDECQQALYGPSNSSSTSGYHGVEPSPGRHQVNQNCNTNNDYFCGGYNIINVSQNNPIVGASGLYDNARGLYNINFKFKDGTSTGTLPWQAGSSSYTTPFNIDHSQDGYYLSSIYIPGGANDQNANVAATGYYLSALDVVFGWKLLPVPSDGVCEAYPATNWKLPDRITSDSGCISNSYISSLNGQYVFYAQGDGNMVLYHGSKVTWAINKMASNSSLCMQGDGNLVAYSNGKAYWASNTVNKGGGAPYSLVMQNDGNLVIIDLAGNQVWQTKTAGK